jgi:hypothetical protein
MRCALTSTPAAHGPLCLRGMARPGTCPRKPCAGSATRVGPMCHVDGFKGGGRVAGIGGVTSTSTRTSWSATGERPRLPDMYGLQRLTRGTTQCLGATTDSQLPCRGGTAGRGGATSACACVTPARVGCAASRWPRRPWRSMSGLPRPCAACARRGRRRIARRGRSPRSGYTGSIGAPRFREASGHVGRPHSSQAPETRRAHPGSRRGATLDHGLGYGGARRGAAREPPPRARVGRTAPAP